MRILKPVMSKEEAKVEAQVLSADIEILMTRNRCYREDIKLLEKNIEFTTTSLTDKRRKLEEIKKLLAPGD